MWSPLRLLLPACLLFAACGGKDDLCQHAGEARRSANCVGLVEVRPGDAAAAGKTCDGIAALRCPAMQFCDHPAGTCKMPDGAGACAPTPDACTELLAPVCGCDGKTYGNDCERRRAGASKDHDGACAK